MMPSGRLLFGSSAPTAHSSATMAPLPPQSSNEVQGRAFYSIGRRTKVLTSPPPLTAMPSVVRLPNDPRQCGEHNLLTFRWVLYLGDASVNAAHGGDGRSRNRAAPARRISAATRGKSRAISFNAPAGNVSSTTSVSARTEAIRG